MTEPYQPPLHDIYDKTDHPDPTERFIIEKTGGTLLERFKRDFNARQAGVAQCVGARCVEYCSRFNKNSDHHYAAYQSGATEEPQAIEQHHQTLMHGFDMAERGECVGGPDVREEKIMDGDIVLKTEVIVRCGLDRALHEDGPQG